MTYKSVLSTNDIEMSTSYSTIENLQQLYNQAIENNQTTMSVIDYNCYVHKNISVEIVSDIISDLLEFYELSFTSRLIEITPTQGEFFEFYDFPFTSANNICG